MTKTYTDCSILLLKSDTYSWKRYSACRMVYSVVFNESVSIVLFTHSKN